MITLGIDIGTSSVKTSLLRIKDGKSVGQVTWPETEMAIMAPQSGWAEQHPDDWWGNIKTAVKKLSQKFPDEVKNINAIGITYQMHGLVLVDKDEKVLRPSIIWCDSRAAQIGEKAFDELGHEFCLRNFLNSPGNFTAAKLRWVQENEPDLFAKIHKAMLPGDYAALKLTGKLNSTVTGLSEGIFWNFPEERISEELLTHWGISPDLLPEITEVFTEQSVVSASAAQETGLPEGVPITYRAGDQPNNAFSLGVLNPGEVAATAGTSGVVYGVMDKPSYDQESRVNSFVHVNHTSDDPRYGVLLCVNGTGILNSWMRNSMVKKKDVSYDTLNKMAAEITPGSEGLMVFPFGNGAERILNNREPGACIKGLSFNSHDQRHLFRAGQEGIVFALAYGMEIMKEMGVKLDVIKAGRANMFLSPVFREVFVNTTGSELKLYDTDGALGAARGAAVGAGLYSSFEEAFATLELLDHQTPDSDLVPVYAEAYGRWKNELHKLIN